MMMSRARDATVASLVERCSPTALLLIAGAGWPLTLDRAAGFLTGYFMALAGPPASRKRLVGKLGLSEGERFTVSLCQNKALEFAEAALAELMLLDLAYVNHPLARTQPSSYYRSQAGSLVMGSVAGSLAFFMKKAGWE